MYLIETVSILNFGGIRLSMGLNASKSGYSWSATQPLELSKCGVHCHSVNFGTCCVCWAGRRRPNNIWDWEEIKIQMVSDSAKSGLPFCPRNMKSPKLCTASASPSHGCLEQQSSVPAWAGSAFLAGLCEMHPPAQLGPHHCVWSTHQIFQLFGQPAGAWDTVLGKIFFFLLLYFILFYHSQRKWAEFHRNSCQCVSWHIPCTTEVNTFIPIVPLYEKQHCLCGSSDSLSYKYCGRLRNHGSHRSHPSEMNFEVFQYW